MSGKLSKQTVNFVHLLDNAWLVIFFAVLAMNNRRLNYLLATVPAALALLAAAPAQAQHVQWAARLVEASSQKAEGKEPFSPSQVLGAPNALPLGEISNNAWIPRKEGANEFIEVK